MARLKAYRLAVHFANVLHLERQIVSDGETFALDQVAIGQCKNRIAAVG